MSFLDDLGEALGIATGNPAAIAKAIPKVTQAAKEALVVKAGMHAAKSLVTTDKGKSLLKQFKALDWKNKNIGDNVGPIFGYGPVVDSHKPAEDEGFCIVSIGVRAEGQEAIGIGGEIGAANAFAGKDKGKWRGFSCVEGQLGADIGVDANATVAFWTAKTLAGLAGPYLSIGVSAYLVAGGGLEMIVTPTKKVVLGIACSFGFGTEGKAIGGTAGNTFLF